MARKRTGRNTSTERTPSEAYIVRGTVRRADGKAIGGATVKAYDQDLPSLRRDELLGETRTDKEGCYEISYTAKQFRRAEKLSADLIVRVYNKEGAPLTASSTIFNAPRVATVDLIVSEMPSEYERLREQLASVIQDVSPAKLTEEDIGFLAGETGESRQHIQYYVEAHKVSKETEKLSTKGKLPPEVFYGFFREGLPAQLPALLAQSPDVQRRGLVKAADDKIIPARFGKEADQILARLKGLIVQQSLKEAAEESKASPVALLATVLRDVKQREAFLTAYVNHTGPIKDFWNALRAKPEFRDLIPDLQFTLQLGALTRNYLPLVLELQRMKQAGEIKALSDLARFDEGDWHRIISKRASDPIGFPSDTPGGEGEKAHNYARAIAVGVEDAFPTAFVTRRLEKDDLPGKVDLLTFFRGNPGFDLRGKRLDAYLRENPNAFTDVTDAEATKRNLKAMQRVYKLAPRYRYMSHLIKEGLDSAHKIARKGPNAFADKYGVDLDGRDQASMIEQRARQMEAHAMDLLAGYAPGFGRVGMRVVPDASVTEVEGIPDWSTLFGSLELCECEHCRSVYSPAAYLVDVLHFLDDRDSKVERDDGTHTFKSAKDILFDRRPDLGEIELTCENTNTPLPYVDLVNEVLENAVAPYPPFTAFDLNPPPGADFEADLNSRTLSGALRNAFNPSLSTEAIIAVGGRGQPSTTSEPWWTIDELGFTYTIHKEGDHLNVVTRSLQTRGSAAERAANPHYVNANAYESLRRRVYPWSLPFDLWWEEARAYLAHLGVPRYQIMETFLPGERSQILNDPAVAREYLGFTTAEADIITGATRNQAGAASPGLWNLWGPEAAALSDVNSIPDPADSTRRIESGNWLDVLRSRVDVFLQQSGLKYRELLDLLDTYYVNPVADGAHTIRIVSSNVGNPDTCDIAELRLNGLDEAAAHRVVRFVRLWRKLGWSMRDLDRAITAFSPANLADEFFTQLSHVQRLHGELNLPVIQLLSWWGPIDTALYLDYRIPGLPPMPSLYEQLFRNRVVTNPLDTAFVERPGELVRRLFSVGQQFTSELGESRISDELRQVFQDHGAPLSQTAIATRLSSGGEWRIIDAETDTVYSVVGDAGSLNIDASRMLSNHVATITVALGISAADFTFLFHDENVIPTRILDPTDPAKAKTLPDDRLTFDNLSQLYRHATLAKALRLPIQDYLMSLRLIDPEPFTTAADTVMFVEKVGRARHSGFSPAELAYLLRQEFTPSTGVAPNDEAIGVVLEDIRNGLQKIAAENRFSKDHADPSGMTTDPNGDLTRQKLALLNWDSVLIEQVIATLNGTMTYETTLDSLPNDVVLPNVTGSNEVDDELQGKINYDRDARRLRFTGPMTEVRRTRLTSVLPNDQQYQTAIDALFDKPRHFVARYMRTFSVRDFAADLGDLPDGLQFPLGFKGKIFFDTAAEPKRLHFVGVMTEQERDKLLDLSNHVPYQAAVNELFAEPVERELDADDDFLTATGPDNEAAAMFDAPTTPEARFLRVLHTLLPYLGRRLSEHLVEQKIAETFKLEAKAAEALLTKWVASPADPEPNLVLKRRSLKEFLSSAFAESNLNIRVTAESFPAQFKTFTLLHKIAAVVTKFKITSRQLAWLFEFGPAVEWLDLNTLPTEHQASAASFDRWLRLADLFELRGGLAMGEPALAEIFGLARTEGDLRDHLLKRLSAHTQWNPSDLEYLVGADGFNLAFPDAFRDERALVRLHACFALLKRLGMSARQCCDLAEGEMTPAEARGITQAVRAKYDEAQWLNLAKPLRDVLREKQRAALEAYLVAHGAAGHQNWRDANDLYAHFLLDVEMSPCMMTSRIKQAISSTQLFVQRCLMGLETDVAANSDSDDAWLWWKWMKNYRVWEANRKIFLYPENWVEPELRDDKSPFFKELESELLQSDLTLESAQTAFLHYLEKLDQVARLEIVGMYRQAEPTTNILHVFGRTGAPHVYYYRQWVDQERWTPWERVDLDIEGQHHLIPVVWNRRLFLFWPIFTEKAHSLEIRGPAVGELIPIEPEKYWEIKLAWSEQKQGKWTNKRVSTEQFIIDPLGWGYWPNESSDVFFRVTEYQGRPYISLWLARPRIAGTGIRFQFNGRDAGPPTERVDVHFELEILTGTDFHDMFLREADRRLYLPAPTDTPALNLTPGNFLLLPPHDGSSLRKHPFFYLDDTRNFFVFPSEAQVPAGYLVDPESRDIIGVISRPKYSYSFRTFYHPYVPAFVSELNRRGVDGLLKRDVQTEPQRFLPRPPSAPEPVEFSFEDTYQPPRGDLAIVIEPYPKEEVDFENDGAYSLYNWELFFHAPLLIADRLSKNQRFEEAQKWFHYIFDPTDTSGEGAELQQRYWRTKKFYEMTTDEIRQERIEEILSLLARAADPEQNAPLTADEPDRLRRYETAIKEWRKYPFKPHVIARLRTTAYQKTVVMKYIDNLIAWGDQLFRRDTIEAINEAAQLYVLAAEILGRRPEDVPPRSVPRVQTYNSLAPKLDDFSNALVQMEDLLSPPPDDGIILVGAQPPPALPMLYFCVPNNDKLLGYWDTVADRLFKIRHCMNIEGVVRQLPLFEPPIEPGLLVRAAAAGVDISSVMNDVNPTLPSYRFNVLLQKAAELCAELKSLGAGLLAALEKRDSEELSLIRAGHETALLTLVEQVRQHQYDEAVENQTALRKSRDVAVGRYLHYQKLLGVKSPQIPAEGAAIPEHSPSKHVTIREESGIKMLDHEDEEMDKLSRSHRAQEGASDKEFWASVAHVIPNANIQPFGLGTTFGGSNVGSAGTAWAAKFRAESAEQSFRAALAGKLGQYALREHEWALQSNQAAKEIMQIDKQIAAAELRKQIASHELGNHRRQTENARDVEEFMRNKYTNTELYAWMVGQVSGVYFQTYQLAYDVAKRAERAYRHELGLAESNFIQFGYWDSLKKGLLAGEKLHLDLKRMELAYFDQNKREYEITKHISLAMLNPLALVRLRETGECFVDLPETLFDMDYPGHYLRRIKTVGLTIPCVTGPYTSINCTLTLLSNNVRRTTNVSPQYSRNTEGDDLRFAENIGAIQSIATSSAQNDSGMFELNFRDERYLPFEGAGAISRWRFELPIETNQFDRSTISDVVIHLRYTAREGGASLKAMALRSLPNDGMRLFSLRHEFPTEWYRFVTTAADREDPATHVGIGDHFQRFAITRERFPFHLSGKTIKISKVHLFAVPKDAPLAPFTTYLMPAGASPDDTNDQIALEVDSTLGGMLHKEKSYQDGEEQSVGDWALRVKSNDFGPIANALNDLWIVFEYSAIAQP